MYYECTRCGRLDRFGPIDTTDPYRPCANCAEHTRWTVAFEGER